jgi:hypothetical protein
VEKLFFQPAFWEISQFTKRDYPPTPPGKNHPTIRNTNFVTEKSPNAKKLQNRTSVDIIVIFSHKIASVKNRF